MQTCIFSINDEPQNVLGFTGSEGVSAITHFDIDVRLPKTNAAILDGYLNLPATLQLGDTRRIPGFISAYATQGDSPDATHWTVRFSLHSDLQRLTFQSRYHLHIDTHVKDTLINLFNTHGIDNINWQVERPLTNLPYWLQTDAETDYDFLQRLLCYYGLHLVSETNHRNEACFRISDDSQRSHQLPSVTYVAPSHTQPDNPQTTHSHSFGFHTQYRYQPERVVLHQFNPDTQPAPMQAHTGQGTTVWQQFGTQAPDSATLARQAAQQASYFARQQQQARVLTNATHLQPGYSIYLDNDSLSPELSGSYYINTLTHHYRRQADFLDYAGLTHYGNEAKAPGTAYYNEAQVHDHAIAYQPPLATQPSIHPYLSAVVESPDDLPYVDDAGRVFVRPHFDLSERPPLHSMPPIARLQQQRNPDNKNHQPVGQATPFAPGTEVLLANLEGVPEQLIAVTSVPTAEHASPVTSANADEHHYSTPRGHRLIMDDAADNARIHLQSCYHSNHITFQSGDNAHTRLASTRGSLQLHSQTLTLNAGQHLLEHSVGQYQLASQGQVILSTAHGNLHLQAGQHLSLTTGGDISAEAGGNLSLHSAAELQLHAGEDGTYVSEAGDLIVEAKAGNVLLHTRGQCDIIGDGSGTLSLHSGAASISIDAQGTVTLGGDSMTLNSANPIAFKGNINHVSPQSAPTPPAAKAAPRATTAPRLHTQASALPEAQHTRLRLILQLPGQQWLASLEGSRYTLTSIDDTANTPSTAATTYTGVISHGGIEQTHINLNHPWCLALEGSQSQHALYINAINGKACKPTQRLYAEAHQYPITRTDTATSTHLEQTLTLDIVPLPINFNYRLYSKKHTQKRFEHIDHAIKIAAMKNIAHEDWAHLASTLRFYSDKQAAGKQHCRSLLTQDELSLIKGMGANVTIFIHGFNVGYGDYGDAFAVSGDTDSDNDMRINPALVDAYHHQLSAYYQRKVDKPYITGYTKTKTSLYRDPENGVLQKYTNAADYRPLDNPLINGSEAHSWWLNMANNLNLATGQFQHDDYSNYTYPIGIAWQGDPSAWNFMDDVTVARYTGLLTATLIKQLHQAGIGVNLISHSMGNAVSLATLQYLGEEGLSESINHVFLWDAAVPNFALSSEPHPSDPNGTWHFPKATEAAKRITVLYSNNDNVLGPIPANQPYQNQYNAAKPLQGELLPALILDKLNLGSVYDMATWAGVPVSELFHEKNQKAFYARWIKQHPEDKWAKPFPKNFEDLLEQYKNSDETFLSDTLKKLVMGLPDIIEKIDAAGHFSEAVELGIAGVVASQAMTDFYALGVFGRLAKTHLSSFFDEVIEGKMLVEALTSVTEVLEAPVYGFAALFDVIFRKSRYTPTPAMGYSGPDFGQENSNVNKMYKAGKIIPVDQAKYLWSHSGMKLPSKDVMDHVYKKHIIGGDGMDHFGPYKL